MRVPAVLEPLRQAWRRHAARYDALPRRDRLALLGAGLALAAAAEFLFVQPMVARAALIQAAVQEQAQAAADEQARLHDEQAAALAALHARLGQQQRQLQALGHGQHGSERLGPWLQRSLAVHGVRLDALRELGSEAVAAPAAPADAALEMPAAATAAAEAPPPVWRHRVELTLGGPSAALIEAVRSLDARIPPARIESVRLAGRSDAAVQAVIVLVHTSQQPTWLVL
jgi:type II secretory pathway component PulM